MNQDSSPPDPTSNVIDYPARDLTITIRAEMLYGELQSVLATESQQLPIDSGSDSLSIADMIYRDLCGPREYSFGTLRDYVIGIEATDGQGRVFHGGGRVVKNVAGYDLCRLMVGSEGKLGRLNSVTLKVVPNSPSGCLVLCEFDDSNSLEAALLRLNTSQTTPAILDIASSNLIATVLSSTSATNYKVSADSSQRLHLIVGFCGPEDVCDWQTKTVQLELSGCVQPPVVINSNSAFQHWCKAACTLAGHSGQEDNPDWLVEIRTLPSLSADMAFRLQAAGCVIYGHIGNGRLWAGPSANAIASNTAELQSVMQLARSMIAESHGYVRVLRGEFATLMDPPPDVQALISKLTDVLGTHTDG